MNSKIRMFLLVLAAGGLLTGCSTTGTVNTQTVSAEYPAYMEVAGGQVYATAERPVAEGAYVEGLQLPDGSFQPLGHVKGEYDCICGAKKYFGGYTSGWMDLTSGTFYPKGSAEPRAPYIAGKQSAKGVFTPDDRGVVF